VITQVKTLVTKIFLLLDKLDPREFFLPELAMNGNRYTDA